MKLSVMEGGIVGERKGRNPLVSRVIFLDLFFILSFIFFEI